MGNTILFFRKKMLLFEKCFIFLKKKFVFYLLDMTLQSTQFSFGKTLSMILRKHILACITIRQEIILYVKPSSLRLVLFYLRDSSTCQFKTLSEITAIELKDFQINSQEKQRERERQRDKRMEVMYQLLSVKYNTRIRIKTCVSSSPSLGCQVPSVTDIYSSAGWMERETWDMFGIHFEKNTDLRRILTDYGFEGHPLRKDFPLSGYTEVRYDDSKKRVVALPLEVAQEFRSFDYGSPWQTR